jgi:hypothetical protein
VGLMTMLKKTFVGALMAGALVVLVAVPVETAAAQGTSQVPTSCHDTDGAPGGGCPTGVNHH